MTPILLASASPRRRELFTHLDLPFTCTSVDIDETPHPGELPETMVKRLALAKAEAAAPHAPESWVVGSDTVVALGDEILGKPTDTNHAAQMLGRLQGRSHRVWTGVAVLRPGQSSEVFAESTAVWFRAMSGREIADYVATGEPMDKAGAYGIQERGAVFVERIEGDYFTVVGLPLCRLSQVLNNV